MLFNTAGEQHHPYRSLDWNLRDLGEGDIQSSRLASRTNSGKKRNTGGPEIRSINNDMETNYDWKAND